MKKIGNSLLTDYMFGNDPHELIIPISVPHAAEIAFGFTHDGSDTFGASLYWHGVNNDMFGDTLFSVVGTGNDTMTARMDAKTNFATLRLSSIGGTGGNDYVSLEFWEYY